jgi:hypothetical protein
MRATGHSFPGRQAQTAFEWPASAHCALQHVSIATRPGAWNGRYASQRQGCASLPKLSKAEPDVPMMCQNAATD